MVRRQFITYLVVGISAYLIEMGSLYCFTTLLNMPSLLSVAISFWIGFVVAFILQKLITFKNHDRTPWGVGRQIVAYSLLTGGNYIFTLGLVALFADTMSVFVVRTIAIAIITLWNYVIYRKFIFGRAKPSKLKQKRSIKQQRTFLARAGRHFSSFRSPYVIFSALVLLATSVWWSVLGALVQASNADQIVDSYFFQDIQTFQASLFPSAHTFMLKWPLFIVERLANYDPTVLVALTVLVSVATVAGLAYILYRIDRRPKVIGTAFLALACILLMIPAQPHAGGLLPVNFAMLTTRNIEYLFYILGLVLIIRAPQLRSKQIYWAVALLSLLVMSDKLFMWMSVGGAGLLLAVYAVARQASVVKVAWRWLATIVAATVISMIMLWILNVAGVTHIVGETGPYGLVQSLKQFAMACLFAFMGLLTNFGANPAFDIGVPNQVPSVFLNRLASPIILPFIMNTGLFVGGIIAAFSIIYQSLRPAKKAAGKKKSGSELSVANLLSLMLIATTIVAIGIFIGTNHYYPVDSRYETIALFALAVATVTYLRARPLTNFPTRVVATLLVLSIAIGSHWASTTYQQQLDALKTINARNAKIAEVVMNHKTDLLVGDYWRVVPINQAIGKGSEMLPLDDCVNPRKVLSSDLWEKDFEHRRFTYLLSLDGSLTGAPGCTVDQVVQAYGYPNASTVIAGTNDNPEELLLFYDDGVNRNHSLVGLSKTATILPINIAQQAKPTIECADNVTLMNIVAHEDDDLLFLNPTIQRAIDAKHCVRTVYVTAGDAGGGSQYWLSRERASEAAYESMLGLSHSTVWVQKTTKLSEHAYVSVASPRGHKEISLIFMHLPDGNLMGQGYSASGSESLSQLRSGRISTIRTVDGQSSYSSEELTRALTSLMDFYSPTVINTQAANDMGHMYHDHKDHINVGRYVDDAYQAYKNRDLVPLSHFIGYPIRELPPNVFDTDLVRKTNAFLSYAAYDGGVCQTQMMCDETPTYNAYLHREYAQ